MSACTSNLSLPAPKAAARPASVWFGWMQRLLRNARTRAYLAEMDPRMLKDIGVSRTEAAREADRWPWDMR